MKWQTYHFDTVESTNQTAVDYPVFSAIIADHQTGGRGRYGRIWENGNGNLLMSLVVPDFGGQNAQLAFGAGVAVAQALKEFDVRLKWPNDVLKDGKKVAGILLEPAADKLIIGIGLNILAHPVGALTYPADDLGGLISKEQAVSRILNEMSACLTSLSEKGFADIREKWQHLSYLRAGEQMAARLPNRTYTGKFCGIDENGLLLLELNDQQLVKISAADVFKI